MVCSFLISTSSYTKTWLKKIFFLEKLFTFFSSFKNEMACDEMAVIVTLLLATEHSGLTLRGET